MTDIKNTLIAIGKYYGIEESNISNGCEHGFKPATDCPNPDCEFSLIVKLYKNAIEPRIFACACTGQCKILEDHPCNLHKKLTTQ